MKKILILTLFLIAISISNNLKSQSSSFFTCDSSLFELYPDNNQIKNKLLSDINRNKRKGVRTIENFNKSVGCIDMKESDIKSLFPMAFLRINVDTFTNKFCKVQLHDKLILWNNGYVHLWNIDKPDMSILSGNNRSSNFKEIINAIRDKEICVYFIYFLNNERYWYPYIAYNKNGKDIIIDKQGTEFHSVEDVIIKHYGSINNYIKQYKDELNWTQKVIQSNKNQKVIKIRN